METIENGELSNEEIAKLNAECAIALKPHIDWLSENIEMSSDKAIRVRLEDFAGACGNKTMKRVANFQTDMSSPGYEPYFLAYLYKKALFDEGFALEMRSMEDGQPVLFIRKKCESDVFPDTLEKWIAEEDRIANEIEEKEMEETQEDTGITVHNIKIEELVSGIGIINGIDGDLPEDAIFDVDVSDNYFEAVPRLCKKGMTDVKQAVEYANNIFNAKSNGNLYEGIKGKYVGTVIISTEENGERGMIYGLTIGSFGCCG